MVLPGELAAHRGAVIEATIGHIGHVDEFVIDEASGQIRHVVLEKGHLWAKWEMVVPVDQVRRIQANNIEADAVYLKLDKAAISALLEPSLLRGHAKD